MYFTVNVCLRCICATESKDDLELNRRRGLSNGSNPDTEAEFTDTDAAIDESGPEDAAAAFHSDIEKQTMQASVKGGAKARKGATGGRGLKVDSMAEEERRLTR